MPHRTGAQGEGGTLAGAHLASARVCSSDGVRVSPCSGFFLGLVLGFLSILWLYSPSLSRKQRLGILLGLVANLLMTLSNWMDPEVKDVGQAEAGDVPVPVITPREGAEGVS